MEAVTEHMMFKQQVELCGAAKAGFNLYIVFLSPQLNPQFRAKSLISLLHSLARVALCIFLVELKPVSHIFYSSAHKEA